MSGEKTGLLEKGQVPKDGYGHEAGGRMGQMEGPRHMVKVVGRGGKILPREQSLRIPAPFRLPGESFVSVGEEESEDVEYKYIDTRGKHHLVSRLWKKRDDLIELAATNSKTLLTALLVVVAVFIDGLRPITLVWAKDGQPKYPFLFSVWVLIVKGLVILFSFGLYFAAPKEERESTVSLREKVSLSKYLVPPSLLYLSSDLINFVMFQYISASTFSVVKQSRLVIVGLLFRFGLKRYLSQIQWIAIMQLVLASILFEAKNFDSAAGSESIENKHEMFGIMLLLFKCLLDSLAIIWMDKYFKNLSDSGFSYPEQQIVYAIIGFVLGFIFFMFQGGWDVLFGATEVFGGWNTGATVSALLSAFYGLLVSIVLRYLDSMIKMFQSLLAVIVTIYLDRIFFGEEVDVVKSIAVLFVLISVFLYKLGTVSKKHKA